MKGRFEIEEIVTQDKGGVVFRARDRDSGQTVALRRILPRGMSGAGFNRRETEEFTAAAAQLADIREEGLRAVVGWGVDAVDGMPWLATEWSEGESLASLLQRGSLSTEAGRILVERGLAVQVALDTRAAGWRLATDAESVVVELSDDDFRFTWWVEPFPGPEGRVRGVAVEIAGLLEAVLGWHRRGLPLGEGQGLAEWIRRVRGESLSASEALAAFAGLATTRVLAGRVEIPLRSTPVGRPVPAPTVFRPATGGGPMKWVWGALAVVTAVVLGLVVWSNFGGGKPLAPGDPGYREEGAGSAAARASERARQLAQAAASERALGEVPLFRSDEVERVRQCEGQRIAVTGVLAKVGRSRSGKSLYLEFSADDPQSQVSGRFWAREAPGLREEDLAKWVGKKIRVEGDVRFEGGTGRVVVHLTESTQVTAAE